MSGKLDRYDFQCKVINYIRIVYHSFLWMYLNKSWSLGIGQIFKWGDMHPDNRGLCSAEGYCQCPSGHLAVLESGLPLEHCRGW